eukprot:1140207-Pelagomonas_calceolata.AAC.2
MWELAKTGINSAFGSWAKLTHLKAIAIEENMQRKLSLHQIRKGKGDTLAQSCGSPLTQGYRPESANGDLEGYWKHSAVVKLKRMGTINRKRKEELHRQRILSLHQLRKRGHIGSEEPVKPDATPAALMQSWSLLTQLTQTDHPLHPHTDSEYCAVWGVAQLQPAIFT